METVSVSSKFQVVIPRKVREELGLRTGEKLCIFAYQNRIEMIPMREMRSLRGFLRGMDTQFERDRSDPR